MTVFENLAGVIADRSGIAAAVLGRDGHLAERRFELTVKGLQDLVAWLERGAVTKVALRQGRTPWPWQVEGAPRARLSGPVDLDYWLEYSGPEALVDVAAEAAWQPAMLVLRDRFTLFVVAREVPASRCTP